MRSRYRVKRRTARLLLAAAAGQVTGAFGGVVGWEGLPEREALPTPAQRVVWPTPPLNEAEDVDQSRDYTTRARVE